MFSKKACAISGNESLKSFRSKKALRTSGQPAEVRITTTMTAKNTTVLVTAIPTLRAPRRSPTIRDRRSPRPVSASTLTRRRVLLQDGSVRLARQPLLLDLRKLAIALQRGERLVDACGEAVALREHHPEMLRRPDRGELADDRRLRDLHSGDVE